MSQRHERVAIARWMIKLIAMMCTGKQTLSKQPARPKKERGQYELLFSQLAAEIERRKTEGPLPTNLEYDRVCELANLIAMSALKEADYEKCDKYLKRADRYNRYSPSMLLVTHNNWSCYYKKTMNANMALAHINKAIKIAKRIEDASVEKHIATKVKLLADCYLNLCAILSSLGDHAEALTYISLAIERFQSNLEQAALEKYSEASHKLVDRKNVLAIAKFNRATELEHLKRNEEAMQQYQSLKKYLILQFGDQHSLLGQVEKAIRDTCTKQATHRRSESTARHFSSVNTEDSRLPTVLKQYTNNAPLSSRRVSLAPSACKEDSKERQYETLQTERNYKRKSLPTFNASLKRELKSPMLRLL